VQLHARSKAIVFLEISRRQTDAFPDVSGATGIALLYSIIGTPSATALTAHHSDF
jgi:hypothetical protein